MTTAATDQLTETIQNLKDAANSALDGQSAGQFVDFENYVNEVEAFVRETQQAMWADDAKTTINNLKKGNPLTPDDQEIIRTFLVSDAASYLKHENNYGDWKQELKRLMDDLVRRADTVDRNTIGDMRGVLKDAVRLVPDIRNYLEEKERIEKFEGALRTLDDASRKMLVQLMTEQLTSKKR